LTIPIVDGGCAERDGGYETKVNTSKPRRAECDGSGDGSGGVVVVGEVEL
jgi:hypothetical protein